MPIYGNGMLPGSVGKSAIYANAPIYLSSDSRISISFGLFGFKTRHAKSCLCLFSKYAQAITFPHLPWEHASIYM